MEEKQLQNRRDNFAFKLSAAKYHQRKIIEVFGDNKDLIVSGGIDNPKARPFVYHYYSIVYEIYSCFDMTLHFVNKKFAIVFNDEDVKLDYSLRSCRREKPSVAWRDESGQAV